VIFDHFLHIGDPPTFYFFLPSYRSNQFTMSSCIMSSQIGMTRGLVAPTAISVARVAKNTSSAFGTFRQAKGAGYPRRPSTVAASSIVAAAAANGDVQGDMLEPSTANNPIVRTIALIGTVAAAAYSTSFLPAAAVGFVHMLAFGMWFGTLGWTSFIFGIVAFRNLPRQTFGKLQAKLFPKYFTVSAAAPALLLATLNYLTGGAPPAKEMTLLGLSLGASLMNLFFTEPAATKVMFRRYELENQGAAVRDEAQIKELAKQFGKWHGISSLLNLIVLICAVGHAYYLGGLLV
jgi:prepilin signal peptidase PulO-like enzyme (type II secretory pathway)